MGKTSKKIPPLIAVVVATSFCAQAQITLSGQLRTRTEVRNGLANLVQKGSKAASFTSQRTRLSVGYKLDRLAFGVALQDVRVWGQDGSSISSGDGNRLMLHEGWAELTLANKADTSIHFKPLDWISLKLGRQELVYDDSKLIGNLDWLQQGRRHDMALLKTVHKGWQVDLGYAFNQHTDAFNYTSNSYVPGNLPAYVKNSLGTLVPTPAGVVPLAAGGNVANNSSLSGTPVFSNPPSTNAANQNYKSFTSLYINKKFKQTKLSVLAFNDNFGKYKTDSVGSASTGYVYGRRYVAASANDNFDYSGANRRLTYGILLNHTFISSSSFGKLSAQGEYYRQTGKNRDGIALNAWHYSLQASYLKSGLSITPGIDVLSGNDAVSPSGKDNRFDPLYGTPHKFWGYMDYFYVGTGSPAAGLNNYYLKLKYNVKSLAVGADYHYFSLHKNMTRADKTVVDKKLGQEIDLQLNYLLNKFTTIELGYSIMKATRSMPIAKAQATTDAAADNFRKNASWFYCMLRFSPEFVFDKTTAKR